MSDVLELGVLHVRGDHAMLRRSVRVSRKTAFFIVIVVVVAVFFAHKVLGALVLVCAAILRDLSVSWHFSAALYSGVNGVTYILVPANGLVNVARGELVQFLVVAEDDDSHID